MRAFCAASSAASHARIILKWAEVEYFYAGSFKRIEDESGLGEAESDKNPTIIPRSF